jgi:hypothetical protein
MNADEFFTALEVGSLCRTRDELSRILNGSPAMSALDCKDLRALVDAKNALTALLQTKNDIDLVREWQAEVAAGRTLLGCSAWAQQPRIGAK